MESGRKKTLKRQGWSIRRVDKMQRELSLQQRKRNYSKEDFVRILGNLFLATGWLTVGIHYLHSVSIAAPLTHLRSMFQFNQSRNPVIIWKRDM